jgi:hypothetical protein
MSEEARPLVLGQVDAWRAWRLRRRRSSVVLMPNGRGSAWPARRSIIATCWRVRRHDAPVAGCTCGLYGVEDPELLRHARSPAVVGRVALWGTVAEHDLGYRGRVAYPQRITLVCHVCLMIRGPWRAQPDRVAVHRDGWLVPLCSRHLEIAALLRSAGVETVDAAEVLAAVCDVYAIDPLSLGHTGSTTA